MNIGQVDNRNIHGGSCRCGFCSMRSASNATLVSRPVSSAPSSTITVPAGSNVRTINAGGVQINIQQTANTNNVSPDDMQKAETGSFVWPTDGERGKIAQELQTRLRQEVPFLGEITPGKVLSLAKKFNPNITNELPYSLFGQISDRDIALNIADFRQVAKFDNSVEESLADDASPIEKAGKAQIFRFADAPHKNTGINLEIVNTFGRPVT